MSSTPTILKTAPAAKSIAGVIPRQMPRHPSRDWLIRESAMHAVAVGNSSRTVAAVLREMLSFGFFAPCPVAESDPQHLQKLMLAIEEFALTESYGIDAMAYCADCISLSCNPTHVEGGEL